MLPQYSMFSIIFLEATYPATEWEDCTSKNSTSWLNMSYSTNAIICNKKNHYSFDCLFGMVSVVLCSSQLY